MNKAFNDALFHQDEAFYKEIKGQSSKEKALRFNVYRNNVYVSLMDALADIFPITQTLVGEDFFRAMAREYLQQNRPKSPIIREYGGTFADFIRAFEPSQSVAFLGDIADLEYKLLTLTHAPEFTPLTHEEVSAAFNHTTDPAKLLIRLSPNTQIMLSCYAIGSIYLAHKQPSEQSLTQLDINNSEHLLLSKSFIYAEMHVISEAEASFIQRLMQDKTLEEAIPDDDTFDTGASLAKLIQWQLITHVSEAAA
ncbi:HvfC/BufC family peptide modification chaperone [Marinomonas shanghaiensis]|uniref:HvfC/BufC family peptide modification chaperone n=1 Tax=Marinomonas shanghaiensis TaxID=2202418 RepID=UPI000DB9779C|nr:DNA-binding domain-containing protein [Marinomonas shanghaiensis]